MTNIHIEYSMSKAEKEVGGKGFSGPIVEKSSKQQMLSKNLSIRSISD